MSADTNTGGPAFPQHGFDNIAERFTSQGGMTLRDYFAAKAMQGFLASIRPQDKVEVVPEIAYAMADAMLKARQV
jgi:hypothetical protein